MTQPSVLVRVLDGEDTIGGTKILVANQGEGAFLDFGINYAKWGHYFEEYVQPRVSQGIGDLWKLQIVPRVRGLYRSDVVPPGLQGGQDLPVKRIHAVFLSHAHLDHAGMIGLLDPDLPLVASPTTAAILKTVQDTGNTSLWTQPAYANAYARQRVGNHDAFKTVAGQPYRGRPLLVAGEGANASLTGFWQTLPWAEGSGSKRRKGLEPGAVETYNGQSSAFPMRAHAVDHSLLGGTAFTIETVNGPIVYSGDIRDHGRNGAQTKRFLDTLVARPPWILLMEGTQVRPPGRANEALSQPASEESVLQTCQRAVDTARGKLVVADFAARNVERLMTFHAIAQASNRKLLVTPKDAYLLWAMRHADASIPRPDGTLAIYDPPASSERGWEGWLLKSEFPQHVVPAEAVRRGPGEYIVCFSFWDIKHLLDLDPKGGLYVYSNSEAFNEEQEIDFQRLDAWIQHFGFDVAGFHMADDPTRPGKRVPVFDEGYHSSGHMPGDHILEWIQRIRPENVLPVHTEHRAGFKQALEELDLNVIEGGLES